MRWLRSPWWFLALAVGGGCATVAMASSVALTSQNLTVLHTCVLTASTAASASAIDAGVKQDVPTTNSGAATTMDVKSLSVNKNHRVYVKFDLTRCSPAVPASATVRLATLRLWTSAVPSACRTEDLFKVTATWAEAGITWNNQPFGASVNNPASGSASATATVGTSPCGVTAAGYVGWTVTADTQAFVSSPATNFGWMIRDDVENASATARTATFSTRELANLAQSPQLVVNYS